MSQNDLNLGGKWDMFNCEACLVKPLAKIQATALHFLNILFSWPWMRMENATFPIAFRITDRGDFLTLPS
jgi:hypothetical protein